MAKKEKSKKKEKRVARNDQAKNFNLLFPIDITQLGSEDDPCFGKLHDPKDPVCISCGDCELCQIMHAQSNHDIREKVEKKGKFKDLEEKEIYDKMDKDAGSNESVDMKKLKKYIRKVIRNEKKLSLEEMEFFIKDTHPTYPLKKLKSLLTKLAEKSGKFTFKNDTLKWIE